MKIKKTCSAIALAISASTAQAGIPVSVMADATATMLSGIETSLWQTQHVADMVKQVEQIEKLLQQYEQMKKDYEAITGKRYLGTYGYNRMLNRYITDDWLKNFEDLRNNGYRGLSSDAKAIRDNTKVFDICAGYTSAKSRDMCSAAASKPAQDSAMIQSAFKKSRERQEQIEKLMERASNTEDPKAISEIQARIQAEIAMMNNENTQIQLALAEAASQDKILAQQRKEKYSEINRRDMTWDLPSVDFKKPLSELFQE
jgi:type IV secretion system protein VirB5